MDKIYEGHPEICFAELTGHTLESKDTEIGRMQRIQAFEEASELQGQVTKVIDDCKEGVEWHRRISKSRLDDVIDAAVLAYTAERLNLGPRSEESSYPALPTENAEKDYVLGIPMEIVYPDK